MYQLSDKTSARLEPQLTQLIRIAFIFLFSIYFPLFYNGLYLLLYI